MAVVKYLLQGIDPARNHEDRIKELLNPAHNYDRVAIYSAFNRSGSVVAIKDELETYGKKATVIIGVRNGSTSKQGLTALFDTGIDLYVVDTGSPMAIFHPKTFVGINNKEGFANVIIGSPNFTPGGFRRNIENSCMITLDLSNPADKQFVDSFLDDQNSLLTTFDEDNVIHVTSQVIIDDLLEEGRIVDEANTGYVTNVGASKNGTKPIKKMKIRSKSTPQGSAGKTSTPQNGAVILSGANAVNLKEVWKSGPLSERDLTIPKGANTNPTGSMLLKKGKYDIDFQTYFRNTVFKDLSWTKRNPKKTYFEYADAKFHFIIDGIEYPAYSLTVHFDTRTDTASYKQSNGTTHLHWGEAKTLVKNRNLLGKTLFLYQIEGKNDEFVIEIKDTDDED